jgi:hypothetical protein
MPEESKAGLTLAQAGPAVAFASALFGAMGFLATRSYLTGLGLPEHTSIALDDYAQHGGRFFFALAAQFLPVSVCTALVILAFAAPLRRSARLRRWTESGHFICLFLAAASCFTIAVELHCLPPEAVFSPGRIRNVGPELRDSLFLIDAGVLVTVAWLARSFGELWRDYRDTLAKRLLVPILLLAVLVEVLLLPLCFGRIQMIPRSFDRVTLVRDKDQLDLKGMLAFAGPESYFIFNDDRMLVEVERRTVREIRYESSESLEHLAKH